MRWIPIGIFLCLSSTLVASPVSVMVNTGQERTAISPYIYGTNQMLTGTEGWTARRQGGNRMTGYNWENNASNAGTDWNNSSDNFMTWAAGIPDAISLQPGIALTAFHDTSIARGCYSLLTLEMAGYVARDKNGSVTEAQTAPSARWREVRNQKGSAFTLTPDTADAYVYNDEQLNFLISRYGNAQSSTGVKGYLLDNEPALWSSTHPYLHPDPVRCRELVSRSVDLAATIKTIDSSADVFGPVLYGFSAFMDLQGAADWDSVKTGYGWFIDYYLDEMKKAETAAGRRLLDVFDVHWYSEARGNDERIVGATQPANRANAEARMQAPRTLWDSSYTEDSWIGQWNSPVALIPHFKKSITSKYPGTKISFTELNHGGEDHISGGIAMADVLGIFGRYGVYFASYWQMEDVTRYTTAAYRLFRNYDNEGHAFGATHVRAASDNSAMVSSHGSIDADSTLHLVFLNKSYDSSATISVAITAGAVYKSARIFCFDSASPAISERIGVDSIMGNAFAITIPHLTACHCVVSTSLLQAEKSGLNPAMTGLTALPNPFNPRVTLVLQPCTGTNQEIDIFSLDGAKVAAFSRMAYEKNAWTVAWDAANLPSGMYIARATADGRIVASRRLMLVR